MAAGATVGARFVVLDDAVKPAGLMAGEEGLLLNWRVGASGVDFSDDHYTQIAGGGGLRALMPLSPVHVRGQIVDGNLALSWIRRSRVDADNWFSPEIPLGEDAERYQLRISPVGGDPLRTLVVEAPAYLYENADILADFGTVPGEIEVSVSQYSAAVGWGLAATRRLALA